jgi:hypothetical protein
MLVNSRVSIIPENSFFNNSFLPSMLAIYLGVKGISRFPKQAYRRFYLHEDFYDSEGNALQPKL